MPVSRIPAEDLPGWCTQYRVWAYGYAGKPIPEAILREDLDCAVQHYAIFGRLCAAFGGLGHRYGAPGTYRMTPAERADAAFEEYEDHEARERARANAYDDEDWYDRSYS